MTLGTVTVVGVVVAAVLLWFYLQARKKDRLSEIVEKRRGSSILVETAMYVEGMEKIPVAVALTKDTFYYENRDLQASFELPRIDEVEYDNELATGRSIEGTHRVLRLRSHGATFEFILPAESAGKWQAALPPRRIDQNARVG